MRVAIVPGFAAEETDDERPSSLSNWAEEEKYRGQLGFVPAHLTAADGIARMLNLGSGKQTFVVQLRGYEMLTPEQAELLDAGFSRAEREVDQEIESWLSEARQLAQDPSPEAQEAARGRYGKVNGALRYELSPRRALALMDLAELERRSGNTKEARTLLDHAIAISPRQAALLERRATLARETGESAVAVAMMQRLLHEVEASDEERANLSATLARESLSAARQALELALKLRPGDRTLLQQLGAVHEASGLWDLAVGTAVELAEGIEDRPKRAQALVAAARLCSDRTGNIPRAVALYEAAIEDDPEVPGAFAAVEAELLRVGDQRGVASAYERQIDRLAQRGASEAQGMLLRKLAELHCTALKDNKAAIRALERLVELLPEDPEARFALARLLEEEQDDAGAIEALEAAAGSAPKALAVYQRLHALLTRGADDDRIYLASSALVALGEADINEQLSYTQYAPEGLPKNAKPFDDDVWNDLLPSGHPKHVDRLMRVLEPAAMKLWFEKVAPSLGSMLPDDKHKVNSKRSTVSAVRCFRWASQLLGVDEPVLYVEPDNVRVSVSTLPTSEPALLLGRPILSGRSVVELSFIAVHHLAYSRPEWRVLAFWTDPVRLQALMTAGISLVKPKLEGSLSEYGHTMRAELADRVDPQARPELEKAVDGLLANGSKIDVNAWARSVEDTACRAALLASGDVTVAGSVLAVLGAPLGGQSAADRARALLPFTVSRRFSELRKRLGLAVS